MPETHAKDESPKTGGPVPDAKPPDGGVELSDEQLDKVAGGFASNVHKTRHDTSNAIIRNIG